MSLFDDLTKDKNFKVGDIVNFHDDFKKMQFGIIIKAEPAKDDTLYSIDRFSVIFQRKGSDLFHF